MTAGASPIIGWTAFSTWHRSAKSVMVWFVETSICGKQQKPDALLCQTVRLTCRHFISEAAFDDDAWAALQYVWCHIVLLGIQTYIPMNTILSKQISVVPLPTLHVPKSTHPQMKPEEKKPSTGEEV
jgi:hypothetical protein